MSGGFNPVNLVSQAALGIATGGTSIIAQLATQVVSQIAQQVLQQVGQQLGLPQPMIDGAIGAFGMASGNPGLAAQAFGSAAQGAAAAAEQLGASPSESGDLQRQVEDTVQQLMDRVNEQMVNGDNNEDGGAKGARGKRGGESFLMALARVMGQALDHKLDDQMQAAKDLDQANSGGDKSHISEMSARVQALGQEVGMISNALNNSIKSIGEAATTLARKG